MVQQQQEKYYKYWFRRGFKEHLHSPEEYQHICFSSSETSRVLHSTLAHKSKLYNCCLPKEHRRPSFSRLPLFPYWKHNTSSTLVSWPQCPLESCHLSTCPFCLLHKLVHKFQHASIHSRSIILAAPTSYPVKCYNQFSNFLQKF